MRTAYSGLGRMASSTDFPCRSRACTRKVPPRAPCSCLAGLEELGKFGRRKTASESCLSTYGGKLREFDAHVARCVPGFLHSFSRWLFSERFRLYSSARSQSEDASACAQIAFPTQR
mmetsp:Transcript_52264/g.147940  ORF Transcript_52264/g.147940 Transcript_52264/m.147940 type:complete len:117 (-) Transcript_52264:9-359(-)